MSDTVMVCRLERLPALLRERRKLLGIGVREAASRAKVTPSTFSRVENGKPMDAATFVKLSAWVLR